MPSAGFGKEGNTIRQGAGKATVQPSGSHGEPSFQPANALVRFQQSVGNQAVWRAFDHSPKVRRCPCGSSGSGAGKCANCREDELLRRSSADHSHEGEIAPQVVRESLSAPGQPLDEKARSLMESRFGRDFRHIRVSAVDRDAAAADAIQARAFTYGNRVVFGRNEYVPNTASGLRLIAHELAHTAQQGSGTPSLQKSLRVGAVDDPQEREADLVADAALDRRPAPILTAGDATVRRAPKGSYTWEPKGKNEAVYTGVDGVKYTVIRKFKPVTKSEKPTFAPGARFAKVFVTITWCKTPIRGQVEAGIDITNQLQNLIPQMLSSGDPIQVLRNAKLTPYIQVVAIKSEKGFVTFNVEADVSRQGVSSVRGGLNVDTPAGTVDISGGVDLPQGGRPSPTMNVRVTPGGSTPEKVDCETTDFVAEYECSREVTAPPSDAKIPITLDAPPRVRYLYFDYARDIVTTTRTDYGKKHPEIVAHNEENFARIREDIQDGFLISSIEGFTSPEGPMDPKGKFEGNSNLSQDRADAAKKELAGGWCGIRRDTCGLDKVTPIGKGELFTKVVDGKEVEGKKLAESAVPEFLEKEGSELTETERQSLGKKRGALAQSDVVYPLLRRAKLTLTGGKIKTEITVHDPGGKKTVTEKCPKEIEDAAELQFGLLDPVKRP
jgi:hypothetical protein